MSETEQDGTELDRKYRDEDWFKQKYVEEDLTLAEMTELCSVTESTLSNWAQRHGVNHRRREYDLSDVTIPSERPWADADLMQTLYHEKEMSTTAIAAELDCSTGGVNNWLKKHQIETRSRSEAATTSHGNRQKASFYTLMSRGHDSANTRGHEIWRSGEQTLYVHRLLAVAEYGYEAVADNHVHHINEIGWDNRPANLELVTNAEHGTKHRKIDGLDRIRVAELVEHGEASTRDLAEILDYDVSPGTLINIHHQGYGGGVRAV